LVSERWKILKEVLLVSAGYGGWVELRGALARLNIKNSVLCPCCCLCLEKYILASQNPKKLLKYY
jgi:hypothetical protein